MVNSGYQPDTKSPSARRADFELLRRIASLERAAVAAEARTNELQTRLDALEPESDVLP